MTQHIHSSDEGMNGHALLQSKIENRKSRIKGPGAPGFRRFLSAFTLIELLVVIGIIGILVAVLLPAFSVIRNKARYTEASAQFLGLKAGLEAFRAEVDNSFPPSAPDNGGEGATRFMIANPFKEEKTASVMVTGGHLLVQALIGADFLGPPGYRDLDRNGKWANDTHKGKGGLYELSTTTGEPAQTRYGGPGRSYVDDKMRTKTKSLNQIHAAGGIADINERQDSKESYNQPLFVDPWDRPILYYRANPAARSMVGNKETKQAGIYTLEDNGLITGSEQGQVYKDFKGVDFGPGAVNGQLHALGKAAYPLHNSDLKLKEFEQTFPQFIWDKQITAVNQPVLKDTYLLISAGPDGRYGTTDDITNWSREGS